MNTSNRLPVVSDDDLKPKALGVNKFGVWVYTDEPTPKAIRDKYEAVLDVHIDLIQRLIDDLSRAPGISMPHEGVCCDQNCGCIEIANINRARATLAAAKAAGFKPNNL